METKMSFYERGPPGLLSGRSLGMLLIKDEAYGTSDVDNHNRSQKLLYLG
jgi:hypothetical protein